MVRLKACYPVQPLNMLFLFNSTMVRLKARGELLTIRVKSFQFHYGTIKSPSPQPAVTPTMVFQFHYGTIKSPARNPKILLNIIFNSTMVRLKVQETEKADRL